MNALSKPKFDPSNIKLIAKDGKFYDNKDLIYVDRSIPQKIENSKKVDIPVQKSTETIKNWFGVKKVELNIKLNNYIPIDCFDDFSNELKDLKVCILSILDETTENYITKLQRMKVIPCSEIEVIESNSNVNLENYSFIRKEGDGSFYFMLPSKDISQFRREHDYAMGFIEMFREAVSPQISMDLAELLIGKDHDEKRSKIEEKYGIDKWNSSYEALFEKSLLSKMIEEYFIKNGLKEDIDKIENVDYSSPLDDNDYEVLFECLKKIGKDICDLNNIHDTIRIDVTNYIKKKCMNSLETYRDIYKSKCYLYLSDKIDKQSEFLKMLDAFDRYDFADADIRNSVNYSIEQILKKKFGLFDEDTKNIIEVDAKYNENYEKCISENDVNQADFDYFIENNLEKRSLLYFGANAVIEAFLKAKKESTISFNSNNEFERIKDNETSTVEVELKPVRSIVEEKKSNYHNGEYCERKTNEINEKNEKAGKEAENIAYIELKKLYPNLIWNSKYTIIPADKNNQPPKGIVCDMWNKSENGNTYFEIKSSVSEFEMSINEYESMKSNENDYYVVLVNRENKTISKHLFKELDKLKQTSKYKFVFKQEKKSKGK